MDQPSDGGLRTNSFRASIQDSMRLLVQLDIVGWEKTRPAIEASKPPVFIGEFLFTH